MLAAESQIGVVDVIWYVIAGLIIGLLARAVLPGRQHMSVIATIVLGVVAAIIGGFLWNAIFPGNEGVAWIGSIIIAIVLLLLYGRFAPSLRGSRT